MNTTPRLTAADFAPEVLHLYDQYVHGGLSRRGFLDAAQRYATGAAGAAGLLAALSPQFAQAQQIAPTDARIQGQWQDVDSPLGTGKVHGYMVRPVDVVKPAAAADTRKRPVVLVVHENRGLNPHIEDIARRLAVDGFIAFAPDALFPQGGYPGDEDKARELFGKIDMPKTRADLVAAVRFLQRLPEGNGRVGVVGFCWGGGMANYLATAVPDLAAAVPFYGGHAPADEASKIKAPLQLHFAGTDERINTGWPAYDAALKAAAVPHEAFVYAGTQHGFNNDTTPRFDAKAAALAWQRTVAFFKAQLTAA